MTPADMYNLILLRCGDQSSTAFQAADVLTELNNAKNYVASQLELKDQDYFLTSAEVTIAANAREASLPTAVQNSSAILHIRDTTETDPAPIRTIDWRQSDLWKWHPKLLYESNRVYVRGDTIGLKYKPDAAVTLEVYYYSVPSDASGGPPPDTGDFTAIPIMLHEYIVNRAVVNLLGNEGSDGGLWAIREQQGFADLNKLPAKNRAGAEYVRVTGY